MNVGDLVQLKRDWHGHKKSDIGIIVAKEKLEHPPVGLIKTVFYISVAGDVISSPKHVIGLIKKL